MTTGTSISMVSPQDVSYYKDIAAALQGGCQLTPYSSIAANSQARSLGNNVDSELLAEGITLAKEVFSKTSEIQQDTQSHSWLTSLSESMDIAMDDTHNNEHNTDNVASSGNRGSNSDNTSSESLIKKKYQLSQLIRQKFQQSEQRGSVTSSGIEQNMLVGPAGHGAGQGGQKEKKVIKHGKIIKQSKNTLIKRQIMANRSWKKDRCMVVVAK